MSAGPLDQRVESVNLRRGKKGRSNTLLHEPGMGLERTSEARDARPQPLHHIVVVDDDPGVRVLLSRLLKECGYDVSGAESGPELERVLQSRSVDLVLLDIMLGQESGLDICRMIRERSQVPIIMISARGQEQDRVAGLDLGADDYIPKPFGRSEVLARIRAVLRRVATPHLPLDVPAAETFEFAEWHYRPRRHELIAPSGAEVELTAAEHELLLSLLRHPQRVIGRDRLLELSRSRLSHSSDRSIDVLISRLRRKMGDGRKGRPMIRTIRGVGYMLAAEVVTR